VSAPARAPALRVGRSTASSLVVAVLVAALFLLSSALARGGFFSSADPGDVGRYHEFAERILDGELPYRDFYMEYPPGAVPTFLVPKALGGDYNLSFKLTVAAAGLGVVAALVATLVRLRADRRRWGVALGMLAVTPVALGAVVLNRYDLWPTLLVSLALLALLAARPRLGFGLLAAGCAVKIYPAVVLPVAAVHILRTRGPRALAGAVAVFAGVFVVLVGPLAALAPGGFGYSVKTQIVRQLHLESLGASVLLAADKVGLYAASIVPGRPGSIDLSGGLPDAIGVVTTVALLAALAAVLMAYWRAEESDELLVAGFAASVAAFVAFSKVISPQFLVWLVPLVPLVARRTGLIAAGLLLAVLVTTQVEVVYEHPLRDGGWPVWVLLVRNGLLVALFVVLLVAVRSRARPGAAVAHG
jgi:uncharacterized membrane protein